MSVTFEQFFSSISAQESGGNYGAVGVWVDGDRPYGKYQVMGANIPSWTRKYYGKSLTPQQYLNNPKAQETVARGVLQGYFNKYGAAGAAAMWYSGQSNPNKTYGNPPVYQYVNEVISRAGGYPSGGSPSNFSTGSTATPKLSSAELAEQYGFVSGFLNSNSELKKLFQQAVAGGWSADKFQAKMRNTKWWKTHSKDEREYLLQLKADPATAKQQMNAAQIKVAQLAKQMGLTGKQLSGANMQSYAYLMVAKGYDEAMIRNLMGQKLTLSSTSHTGEAGEAWDQLSGYAYSMGVKFADTWMATRVKNIMSGKATQQDVKNELANLAKAQFPQWTKQIDAGQTVADIANPYMSSMSQILELPSGSINLFDPTIKKALNYTNPGTLAKEAKPLWQFENELRADPRWKQTKNAQDSLFQVGHQVLADFGFKY